MLNLKRNSFTLDDRWNLDQGLIEIIAPSVSEKDSRAYALKQDLESDLQAELEGILKQYRLIMADYVKRGKDIPQKVYDALAEDMRAVLEAHVKKVYIDSSVEAQTALDKLAPIAINWSTPNVNAANWARQYTFDLVRGLEDTTIAQVKLNIASLQKDVSDFFGKPTTLGELRGQIGRYIPDWTDRLGHVWSTPVRAEMIAVTETTRASVQGQLNSVKFLKDDYGIDMVSVWQTANDEKVCEICGPNNGKREGEGWTDPPPAHPNCRCGISSELA